MRIFFWCTTGKYLLYNVEYWCVGNIGGNFIEPQFFQRHQNIIILTSVEYI